MINKIPTTVEEFLEMQKVAFVPAEKTAGAAPMPPQGAPMPDPSMQGQSPIDPSMMPPPGMPMDPSQGGMPPMDPSMGGAPTGDPMADIVPMLEEFGSTVQKQEQDINALRQELNELKQAFIDMKSKFSQMAGQYSTIISIMQGGKLPDAPKIQ